MIVYAFASLILLLCLALLAVDWGRLTYRRQACKDAVDAVAMAAAAALAEGADPQAAAREIAALNDGFGLTLDPNNFQVEVGTWYPGSQRFTPGRYPSNAVQVNFQQVDRTSVFGSVFNGSNASTTLRGNAVAYFEHRDIMLVLDFSGSMWAEDKIGTLRTAVDEFCSTLESFSGGRDRLGLVIYSDGAEVSQSLTTGAGWVSAICAARSPGGATNIGDGLRLALDQLQYHGRPSSTKMVLLLTDGLANRPLGVDPKWYVLNQVNRAANDNVPVFAISFGSDADTALMDEVAQTTSSKSYHVGSSWTQRDDLIAAFREVALTQSVHLVK
jgi:Mg-chelatase subunit ChlD